MRTQIGIMLRNYGMEIAEDIFINLSITSHPGRRCVIEFRPSEEKEVWRGSLLLNQHMQMITRADVRLPPEADLMPLSLDIKLQNPIENDFAFEGFCGSAGGEPWRFQFRCDVSDIVNAFDRFAKTPADAADAVNVGKRFNRIFYKELLGP